VIRAPSSGAAYCWNSFSACRPRLARSTRNKTRCAAEDGEDPVARSARVVATGRGASGSINESERPHRSPASRAEQRAASEPHRSARVGRTRA
jgi:hypothetical protein